MPKKLLLFSALTQNFLQARERVGTTWFACAGLPASFARIAKLREIGRQRGDV
jgi:hypothetical protein